MMTETTPMGHTIDWWLDWYDQHSMDVPHSLFEDADNIFDITDDDDIPQGYFLWIARNYYRLLHNQDK